MKGLSIKLESTETEINKSNIHLVGLIVEHDILIVNENNNLYEVKFPIKINGTFTNLLEDISYAYNFQKNIVSLIFNGEIIKESKLENIVGSKFNKSSKIAIILGSCLLYAKVNGVKKDNITPLKNHRLYADTTIDNILFCNENIMLSSIYFSRANIKKLLIYEIDLNPNDFILKKKDQDIDYSEYLDIDNYQIDKISGFTELDKNGLTQLLFQVENIEHEDWYEENKTEQKDRDEFMRVPLSNKTNNDQNGILIQKNKFYYIKCMFKNYGNITVLKIDDKFGNKVSCYIDFPHDIVEYNSKRPFLNISCNKSKNFISFRGYDFRKFSHFNK